MAITVFTHDLLRKAEEVQGRLGELDALAKEFAAYKRTGKLPLTFGRDFPYDWPRSAVESELQHLHLHDASVHRPWLIWCSIAVLPIPAWFTVRGVGRLITTC